MRGFRTSLLAASLFCLPAAMMGQAEAGGTSVSNTMPANNFGFNLPSKLGTMTYSLSASEQVATGYSGGGAYTTTTLNGNLGYLSKSETHPFSLVYSGGLFFSSESGTSNVNTYQNVSASQVFRTRSWVFVASDSFSFLPDSPTTGLSGIAGVGDVGIPPVQVGPGPTQTILTNNASRIGNGLQGSATWQTTASLSFQGSAAWSVLHFTGDNSGANSDEISASVGPNYRIDARNSVGVSAFYDRITYPGTQSYLFETEGVTGNYTRAWSRRLSTTFSFGPARTHGMTVTTIPSQWNLEGSASASYATRTTGFFAGYSRAVNGGSGVIYGALTDSVSAGMNRPIDRNWILGLSAGYSHNRGLAPIEGAYPAYNSIFGGAQVSRRLTESFSLFGSYTGISQSQSSQVTGPGFAFNGLTNIFSVGITFAPAPLLGGR
jgi:hypothetical protein